MWWKFSHLLMKVLFNVKSSTDDKAHSPDCNGILFLRWLEKSAGEKDIVESGKQLLKKLKILRTNVYRNH